MRCANLSIASSAATALFLLVSKVMPYSLNILAEPCVALASMRDASSMLIVLSRARSADIANKRFDFSTLPVAVINTA